jgi:AcrR family transcriptional regulator
MAKNAGTRSQGAVARRAGSPKAKPAPAAEDPRTREVILEAALEAFSRDGYEGASLPTIARAAKVGHPLIHYYFGSKDNLWHQTVEYAFGDLMAEAATIEAASRDLSPIDRLRVLIRTFSLFSARHPSHLGLIMSEWRAKSERLTWLNDNYTGTFVRSLRRILLEAREAGQIKAMPVDHLGFIIMGSIVLFFSLNFELPEGTDMDRLADQHASWVLEAILKGIEL